MQITVFGANGRVGSLVVERLLQENIQVVAFVHGKSALVDNANLRIVDGDIYNKEDVDSAIKGSDKVISTLGSWGTANKDILTVGMTNIIPAMEKYGIKRIVSLTGADAAVKGDSNKALSLLSRTLLKLFAGRILKDGQDHLELLMNSGLDWTVVRSPVMNDKGAEADFVLTKSKPMPWATINRSSVARSIVTLSSNNDYVKQAPYIKRGRM